MRNENIPQYYFARFNVVLCELIAGVFATTLAFLYMQFESPLLGSRTSGFSKIDAPMYGHPCCLKKLVKLFPS
jgi:hypothetical protein